MYGIALSVVACLQGGTRVDVAINLDPQLTPRFDPTDAVGLTPGGGRLGSLLGGALDSRLIELSAAKPANARIIDIELNAIEADLTGATAGTRLRVLLAPAETLPVELWEPLLERAPIGLRAILDDSTVTSISVAESLEAGVLFDNTTLSVGWAPTPTLVVMGPGPMAEAIAAAGEFVGWNVEATGPGVDAAVGLATSLSPLDGVVVVGHDIEGTGRVIQTALSSRAGYIGSVGPPRVQASRADWLAYRGITDLDRVRLPAGLEIGARAPREVAIAVVAEMIKAQNAG